jgi:uncharacterized protein YqgC (DUF456 family)
MEAIAVKSGLIVLYLFLFSCLALTVLGLAGNWVLVAIALVLKLTGVGEITWGWWLVMLGLAVVGEALESLLGLVVVAKKGGTRWGVIGSFIGGIVGAILGAGVLPPVGSLVFAFVGAFGGAAIGEYWRAQKADEALRVGFWSFVGRAAAAMAKVAMGLGIIWIIIVRTW